MRQSIWVTVLVTLAVGCGGISARAQSTFQFPNAPNANSVTPTTVTCGTTSTAFGVTGNTYLGVLIPPTASQNVGFAWGANATATLNPPSEVFSAGSMISWAGGTGACIVASGTQTITVETK